MLGIAAAGPLGPSRIAPTPESNLPRDQHDPGAREREAWAVLTSVTRLGPVTLTALVEYFGTPERVLALATLDPAGTALLNATSDGAAILTAQAAADVAERARNPALVLEPLHRLGLRVLLLSDPDYPPRLLGIELPPPVLFVRGDTAALDHEHAIGVVGTRRPTDAGRALAMRLAAAIASNGGCVISGLAIGIDGAAHAAVAALDRPTVAVLGSGHDHLYPRAHEALAGAIVDAGGAVVSELAPNEEATRWTFPRRNRLISGLSDATVVVQAPMKSGALGTAAWALEQGRGCFLVPGRINDAATAGSLDFIRRNTDQARIVSSVEDLVEDLGLTEPRRRIRRGKETIRLEDLGLSSVESALAELLRTDGHTVDDLVRETALPVATILGALTLLEMRDLVANAYGRYRPTVRLATAKPARTRKR